MKTIKTVFFSLLVLFIGTSLITSCSNDEETNSNVLENTKVSTYLKSFYSTSYQLGKSVETKSKNSTSELNRSAEVENVVITEVFVGDDAIARGYVVTDKNTNDFLYFIDVNRLEYKLTTVKIDVNDTKVFNNIDELDKYLSTDEFDYIKIAEDYVAEQSSERRFWGWGPMFGGPCVGGVRIMYHTYYVFGIGVDTDPVLASDGVSSLQEPCGEAVLGD
jgi:hypothetical protein